MVAKYIARMRFLWYSIAKYSRWGNMNIGDRIRERRTELGWSQRELAEKMGYNHSTVGRIERG